VLLNDGNAENAYCWPPAVSVGGPVNGVADPWARTELPCGIVAMRAMIWPAVGDDSGGYAVAGWVTQIPGSMCRAPSVNASLIRSR
jgi:hypothetical protein